ncbi:MAG: PIN domain-containing protein [Pseudomonadota bacterium]
MANGPPPPAHRWFLDACVLYPQLTRGLLTGAAAAGLAAPFWSDRVLDEWRIAAARAGGMAAEAEARAAAEAMAARFPNAAVAPDPVLEATLAGAMRDPADAHVAAGAAAAGAVVITANLRDFPVRRLAAYGIAVQHPDSALWALFSAAEAALRPAIAAALAALATPALDAEAGRRALKRAGLPRLGKAWAA